jgi:hypothetical protein
MFATKSIKRGAYIATYRGRRISTKEADRREAGGARYMFELNSRWTIDGSPRWNVARYINHSCRPNAKPVDRRGGIVIVAKRVIKPDEENKAIAALKEMLEKIADVKEKHNRPAIRPDAFTPAS